MKSSIAPEIAHLH